MKILFLCSCLEPGQDGVGDYTRRLSGALQTEGHRVSVIALNDPFISEPFIETFQYDGEHAIKVLRLSARLSWKDKQVAASKFINYANPDWISLQYVPYGFHKKGLPFGLGAFLFKLNKRIPWHIMFHELWVGISTLSPLKHKIYGYFQVRIVKNIHRKLNPGLVTTSNKLYHLLLENRLVKAEILPLFSNISLWEKDQEFANEIFSQLDMDSPTDYYILGTFGSLYADASLESVLSEQYADACANNKKMAFITFGRSGDLKEYHRLKKRFEDQISFIYLGELSERKVSTVFQILDKAVACTPEQHFGRSGVYAAMRLHNLEILSSNSKLIPEYQSQVIEYNQYLHNRKPQDWNAAFVSKRFIDLLNT
jgi:hypothetical protein